MGMFEDLDVASAQEMSDGLPPDTYAMIVSSAEVKPTKAGTMRGLTLVYSVVAGKYKGRTFLEWQRVPHKDDTAELTDDSRQKCLDYLKTRMLRLGIPESKINDVDPSDLVGQEVIVQLYKSKGYVDKKTQEKVTGQVRIGTMEPGTFTDDEIEAMPGGVQASGNPFAVSSSSSVPF